MAILGDDGDDDEEDDEEDDEDEDEDGDEEEEEKEAANDITGVTSTAAKAGVRPDISSR